MGHISILELQLIYRSMTVASGGKCVETTLPQADVGCGFLELGQACGRVIATKVNYA